MSGDKYYQKYRFYKAKCNRLTEELQQKQAIMESCRILLDSGVQAFRPPSPLVASSPNKLSFVSRHLSFTSVNNGGDASKTEICSHVDDSSQSIVGQTPEKRDPDETFFDAGKSTPQMPNAEARLDLKQDQVETKPKLKLPRKRALSPLGHICRLPRCKAHHPFNESSKKKLRALSPETRAMGTTTRSKSPKGLWSLTMPSTQEGRSRNF